MVGRRVAVLAAVAFVAGTARAAETRQQELLQLRAQAQQLDAELRNMEGFYARDAAVVDLDQARQKAVAAYEAEIAKRVKENERGAKLLEQSPAAEKKARDLETQWRQVEAEANAMADVVAAQKATEDLRRKADEARRELDGAMGKAYALAQQKLAEKPEWVQLRKDLERARADREDGRRQVEYLRTRLVQSSAILDAENALNRAREDLAKTVQSAVEKNADTAPARAVIARIGPQRQALDVQCKAQREKVAKSPEAVALKAKVDEAEKTALQKRAAKEELVKNRLDANPDVVKMRADLKAAKDDETRRTIEQKLQAAAAEVNKADDVNAARAARDEAQKAAGAARAEYEKRFREMFLADAAVADAEKQLQELAQAESKLREIQGQTERGDAVKSERNTVEAARAKLDQARLAVAGKARESVAATDRGAALLKEKAALEAKIKELEAK